MKEVTSIIDNRKVRSITMTENLEISDDGYDGTILLLNPNGVARVVIPTGLSFHSGYKVTVFNMGNRASIKFDPNGLNIDIFPNNSNEFIYSGSRWVSIKSVLSEVCPEWFGAKGDGTTDDTAAIQAAVTAGSRVVFGEKTYLVESIALHSNLELYGSGDNSVLKALDSDSVYILTCDSGSSDTGNNIANLHIHDLQLLNKCDTDGFSEHKHNVNLNGVSNVVIERCLIKGFRGDGIYLGSGNTSGHERHNKQITIRQCEFDGIDSENRDGITVIDGDNVLIEQNNFVNTTKSGYPGSITVEPNSSIDAFSVIRNIVIRYNRISGGNGDGIVLNLRPQSLVTNPQESFLIAGNYIEDKPYGFGMSGETAGAGATDSTHPYNVLFFQNTIRDCDTPFIINGARGVDLLENNFEDCDLFAQFGYTDICFDNQIISNTFNRVGLDNTSGGRGLQIRSVSRLLIEKNRFIDTGRADGTNGFGIEFVAGYSGDNIWMRDNLFSSPTSLMTRAMRVWSTYTLDAGSCEELNNRFLFTTTVEFVGNYSKQYTAAPTSGIWSQGSVVYNKTPATATAPGWVCVFGFSTTLNGGEPSGETNMAVTASTGALNGDIIGVKQDGGTIHWTTIASGEGTTTLVLTDALTDDAATGNAVYITRWKAMASLD